MSFVICFSLYDHEEPAPVARSKILARFEGHIAGDDGEGNFRLAFEEGPTLSELCVGQDSIIDGFVVREPPDYPAFWEIVAGIVRDLPCLLYWPGMPPASVVGSLDMLPHLPTPFVESMGVPWISTDPERIRRYVWENS